MYVIAAQPSLDQIYGFISKVRDYPVSVSQLVNFARDIRSSKELVKFYERFGTDQVFDDQEELTCRSEQVGILRSEEADMPRDGLFVAGED